MIDKNYMRGNIYVIFGTIMLYVTFKMFNERSEVIADAPVLPWIFMGIFAIAGIAMIAYGGMALKQYKKQMKEEMAKAKAEQEALAAADFDDFDDYEEPEEQK